MTRDLFAIWTLLVSFVIGFVGMVMFYGNQVGLSYPLFIGLLTAGVVGSARYANRPPTRRNLWLFGAALFFATMIAIRASGWLLFWNSLASLTLFGLALHFAGLRTPFDITSTARQVGAVIETGLRAVFGEAVVTLILARRWFSQRSSDEGRRVVAVVRGLVLTVPVIVVFGALLGSADAVFSSYIGQIGSLFALDNIDALIGRVIVGGALSWLTAGVITYTVLRHWQPDVPEDREDEAETASFDDTITVSSEEGVEDEGDAANKRIGIPFRIGLIESGMLLGGVNTLFGAFVLIQAVYLFGGRAVVTAEGLTYAEYARRGFFELVAVSVMTMGLLLVADRLTVREGKRENMVFRVLSLIVIGLVAVMLASAGRRMALYTSEFDLTQLRLWTSVFMGWLVVLFGFLVAGLFRLRRNIFSLGIVVSAIGFFATMNLINPDALIASHNIQQAIRDDKTLDVCYLTLLSEDAVPVMGRLFERIEDGEVKSALGTLLHQQVANQNAQRQWDDSERTLFEFNVARSRAAHALDSIADEATEYPLVTDAPNGYFSGCWFAAY